MVSRCTKSTARMPPARGGQGPLPGRAGGARSRSRRHAGICCTVKAATRWPSLTRSPCARASRKPRPCPRDQVISADRAVGASLSPDPVPLKIDRFGPRAARGTLEPPPVRDKNGLRRLRTVTAQESRSYGHGQRQRSEFFDVACGDVVWWVGAGPSRRPRGASALTSQPVPAGLTAQPPCRARAQPGADRPPGRLAMRSGRQGRAR
jgi:hypothetical protein